MTAYLRRLIARANGADAVVRPLLTPAFAGRDDRELEAEPVVDADAEESRVPDRLTDRAPALDTLPAPRARASTPVEPQLAMPHGSQHVEADIPKRTVAPLDLQADRATDSARARAPLGEHRGPADEVVAARSPRPSDPPEPSLREPTDGVAAIASRAVSREPGSVVPPQPAAAGAKDPVVTPPVVRIAIGRIEIRANVPRTTLAPRAAQPAAQPARRFAVTPKLTLEDYLKRGAARP